MDSQSRLLIAEAHHRVKNTLQNIISYINVTLSHSDGMDREAVKKLVRYIHSLTSLHGILLEEIKAEGDGKSVRLDRLLGDVLAINAQNKVLEWSEIPELSVTPRCAATLSLIVNEVLSHIHPLCVGPIHMEVLREGKSVAVFKVTATMRPEFAMTNQKDSAEIEVAKLLASTDLQSALEICIEDSIYRARFSAPLLNFSEAPV